MANLEEYLQAILDKIADGTETTLPVPSWNHEKYLAAIYDALSEGGGGGGGNVAVVNIAFTGDEDTGEWSFTADKTLDEIVALSASQKILAFCTLVDGNMTFAGTPTWLAVWVDSEDENYFGYDGRTDFIFGATGVYIELSFGQESDDGEFGTYTNYHIWQKTPVGT